MKIRSSVKKMCEFCKTVKCRGARVRRLLGQSQAQAAAGDGDNSPAKASSLPRMAFLKPLRNLPFCVVPALKLVCKCYGKLHNYM
ncbi:hypothetical protein NL676_035539 [Syzygium grande]|nr:hypothetical protein NL676_035539 [Syzygium grande]